MQNFGWPAFRHLSRRKLAPIQWSAAMNDFDDWLPLSVEDLIIAVSVVCCIGLLFR
jgi:hypothetical protein